MQLTFETFWDAIRKPVLAFVFLLQFNTMPATAAFYPIEIGYIDPASLDYIEPDLSLLFGPFDPATNQLIPFEEWAPETRDEWLIFFGLEEVILLIPKLSDHHDA